MLNHLIGVNSGRPVNIISDWSDSQPYHYGVDLECSYVYNVCPGVVSAVGKVNGKFEVTVSVNSHQCIRYCNLDATFVESGDSVDINTLIGSCKKYVHLEYCKDISNPSEFVRIHNMNYYKYNPMLIVCGVEQLDVTIQYQPNPEIDTQGYELDAFQEAEFENAKGD